MLMALLYCWHLGLPPHVWAGGVGRVRSQQGLAFPGDLPCLNGAQPLLPGFAQQAQQLVAAAGSSSGPKLSRGPPVRVTWNFLDRKKPFVSIDLIRISGSGRSLSG